jgi:small subunit ribosomal protein S19
MSRSIWKKNVIHTSLLRNSRKNKRIIKVWSRSSVIPQFLQDSMVSVYNGKTFKKLNITREKVGFKFGAFVKTRTKPVLEKSKKNQKLK